MVLKLEAKKLHALAKVPTDGGCSIEELKKFQKAIKDFQIVVFSLQSKEELLFKGPEKSRKIYLILDEETKHYNVISGPKAFFGYQSYCETCNKPYQKRYEHSCEVKCFRCSGNHDPTDPLDMIKCDDCFLDFYGQECFDIHKAISGNQKKSICMLYRVCTLCGVPSRTTSHRCGILCKKCHVYHAKDVEHQCFMKPKKIRNNDNQKYIFFDIESQFVHSEHIPILIIAHEVCQHCANNVFNPHKPQECDICNEKSFQGISCVKDFIEWIMTDLNDPTTVLAHNLRKYDGLFILKTLHELGKSPEIKNRGTQILEINIPKTKVRFIDSLSFLLKPLSKLPKMFGLTELKKGFFPYTLCTPENMNYDGPFPSEKYYDPTSMKGSFSEKTGELTGEIQIFKNWYEKNKNNHFNLQKELYDYCNSDVMILKQACLIFRKNFLDNTGIDPFQKNITISQLCMDFFKCTYLQENTIALIPPNGYYNHQRQSEIAIKWLKFIESTKGITLQYKSSLGEKNIGSFRVDGYHPESKTVYEFLGDYWHGNLSVYNDPEMKNTTLNKTIKQLNIETMQRIRMIENQGYKVEYVWENDFVTNYKNFIDRCSVIGPLNPRDAFYGGRTNCTSLKYEAKEDEKIRYYDFCSLYPYINKYGRYPIGHPEIILKNFEKDISNYYGLIKCKILPPTNLFHPVLPSRLKNGKLVFSLCSMCANECLQSDCSHTEEQRAILGTWTTPEVIKAIELNYKIIEIYEVWNFPETSQYNPDTGEGGLFSEYVNKFMTLKLHHSGWPVGCNSDEDKEQYINSVREHEGIELDSSKISFNSGLREQAKLMLNSFWGKFGQKSNLSKKRIVKTRKEYLDIITDDKFSVEKVDEITSESLMVTYKMKESFIEGGPSSNIIIACFTTALARLKLYDLLYDLGERALYFDTDSCIFIERPGKFKPDTGVFLGQLTDELPKDRYIKSFYSGGPKNYCYILNDFDENGNKSKCVIKGVSMNFSNSDIVTPETMASKIESYVKKGDISKSLFYETNKFFKRSPDLRMFMIHHKKHYRITYDKRRCLKDFSTVPYGYKTSK